MASPLVDTPISHWFGIHLGCDSKRDSPEPRILRRIFRQSEETFAVQRPLGEKRLRVGRDGRSSPVPGWIFRQKWPWSKRDPGFSDLVLLDFPILLRSGFLFAHPPPQGDFFCLYPGSPLPRTGGREKSLQILLPG